MIIGVDVGYSHTKICTKKGTDIFLSTVEEGINDINKKAITIEFEGKEYTVGEKTGKFSVDLNKINDLTFRLCLFTAIAKQMNDTVGEIQLVTGLPAEYYKSQKQELITSLEGLKVTIVLNDIPKKFTITKCLVFPQSAGLFILNPNKFEGDNIIVDIGGLTVDVSYFNDFTLAKTRTYELGMLKLYDILVQKIKSEYGVSYEPLAAERIIKEGTIIRDGKTELINGFVNAILADHADNITRTIKNALTEYTTSKRHFIGGGSYVLRDYFPGFIDQDDIYTNARAFYHVGVDKFEG